MSSDLVEWLKRQLDEDERVAKLAHPGPWEWSDRGWEGRLTADAPDYHRIVTVDEATKDASYFDFMLMSMQGPDRVLREVEAKRRILDEHAPEWRTVEWPHDQNGKGEAQVCRRCQNAEHTEWHPAVGEAGVLPEGFVAPYVLAPCVTLRMLALPYADRPGYQEEWRP